MLRQFGDDESDPRRLALIYGDASLALSERTVAFAELLAAYASEPGCAAGEVLAELLGPEVRRLAREAAHGGTRGDRDEFVEESISFVVAPRENSPPRVCLYRAEAGPLEPWLRELIKNGWRDKCRAAARRRVVYSDSLEAPAQDAVDWPDEPEILIRLFSPADLGRIGQWKAAERIELLCLAGLWRKVTVKLWESWLMEYEEDRGLKLARPLPPPSFVSYRDPPSRTQMLARALAYRKSNNLSQHWRRWQHRLGELDFIQAILPNVRFAHSNLPCEIDVRRGDLI